MKESTDCNYNLICGKGDLMENKLKILAFSPYAGIWEHSFPEATTLKALTNIAEIKYIGCNGLFDSFCITMSAKGITPHASLSEKRKVCSDCIAKKKLIKDNYEFNSVDIDDYVNDAVKANVTASLNKISKDNFMEFAIDGVELGKISVYEIVLNNKKNNIKFDDNEWSDYLNSLENSLYTYYFMIDIIRQYCPDRILVYNSLYSTNNVVYQLAKILGISSFFLHAGRNWSNRLDTMIVAKNTSVEYNQNIASMWSKFKDIKLSINQVKLIYDHFDRVIRSNSFFNYSSKMSKNFSFYDTYPMANGAKIFLATLSSSDERFAANLVGHRSIIEGELFNNQTNWVKWLVKYFSTKSDSFLIIRVHPRDFPNKRYKNFSDNARNLKKNLVNLPSNIMVNWPDENISIYDLATEVDVLLNSHSSSSLDFLYLGLPVVVYDKNILTFPLELHYYGFNESEYISAIEKATNDSWRFDNVYKLYKWMNIQLNLSVFDISDATKQFYKKKTFLQLILRKIFPLRYSRKDIKNSEFSIKEKNNIEKMILHDLDTRLDIVDPSISGGHDHGLVINNLQRVLDDYYGSSKKTKLYNNIKLYLNSDDVVLK